MGLNLTSLKLWRSPAPSKSEPTEQLQVVPVKEEQASDFGPVVLPLIPKDKISDIDAAPSAPKGDRLSLRTLAAKAVTFQASPEVNSAYLHILRSAKEISLKGHTKGSLSLLKDQIQEFRELRDKFAADFNDPQTRKNLNCKNLTAAQVKESFDAMNTHLKLLIANIKDVCAEPPAVLNKPLGTRLRGEDTRRLNEQAMLPLIQKLGSHDKSLINARQALRNAKADLEEATQNESGHNNGIKRYRGDSPVTYVKVSFNKLTSWLTSGSQKKAAEVSKKEQALEEAKNRYVKVLETVRTKTYKNYYGLKATIKMDNLEAPEAAVRYCRPLSTKHMDLSYTTMYRGISSIVDMAKAKNPLGNQVSLLTYGKKGEFNIRRTSADGTTEAIEVRQSNLPGRSMIKIDGEDLCAWNNQVSTLVRRFSEGKELKIDIRRSGNRLAQDVIFMPVSNEAKKQYQTLSKVA